MDNGAGSYRRYLDGDDSGLVEIIRDYKDGLILYLNGFVRSLRTAEELTEDTFVKLAVKRPKYHGRASFKTWLYAIGRNTAIDYLRRNSGLINASAPEEPEPVSEEISLEQAYIREERKIIVHQVLRRLKPEYRRILWLIYFENFSNKEAAKIMKKTVHGTETLVYRARQSLKSELDKEGFLYEEL